jgi:DNA-directed RNA polymerase subunit alpha
MIPLPSKPKVINKKDNWAQFEMQGLYPGYGATIGNAMRRVLLSSLQGAAITQIKIKGADHEFSTISGVLEDVVGIIMNLKQLRFKSYADEPMLINLSVKGEKTVKGSDLKLPTQVELANKDAHIATLTDKKAELVMEILVEQGIGYEPAEKRQKEKTEIGTIAMDAIFTPIKKIGFRVEDMRVGGRTDFNRLILDIETDGTISPEQAFSQSADILIKHFSLFCETFPIDKEIISEKKIKKSVSVKKEGKEKVVKKKVDKKVRKPAFAKATVGKANAKTKKSKKI